MTISVKFSRLLPDSKVTPLKEANGVYVCRGWTLEHRNIFCVFVIITKIPRY